MRTTPDRLAGVIEAIEKGEPVEWGRLSLLQTLDLVRAGRGFAEDATEFQEAQDARAIEAAEKAAELGE